MKRFILQAVTDQNHVTAIKQLVTQPDIVSITFSTAFMTEAGLDVLGDDLAKVSKLTMIFVGIRNGITTAQSLQRALEIGCTVYAVDTGSRSPIFHPKLYFQKGAKTAHLIIGSANLTVGGLNSNIEASLFQELLSTVKEDADLVNELETRFDTMRKDYPSHVIHITSSKQIDSLLNAGRLIDEDATPAPGAYSSSGDISGDKLGRMKLQTKAIKRVKKAVAAKKKTKPKTDSGKPIKPMDGGLELLWESSELVRRDLDIPIGENTNPTGSMLLKKGNSDIDQQSYFRSEVFKSLAWTPDPKTKGKELAEADFQLIIRGIDYGLHKLTITNDTRTDTKTYEQKQPMSAIRWGEARPLIAREDLLERTMRLFRDPAEPEVYVIDID